MVDNSNSLLCYNLTNPEKEKFYKSVIDENLDLFISYLSGNKDRKPFNIFEEVSQPGYKWTVFHYAMHYGKWDIIKYIFEYLTILDLLDKALKMKTKDNRCPLLCLLKSNALNPEEKEIIFSDILKNFDIPISNEVKEELYKRNMQDLLSANIMF